MVKRRYALPSEIFRGSLAASAVNWAKNEKQNVVTRGVRFFTIYAYLCRWPRQKINENPTIKRCATLAKVRVTSEQEL